MMPGADAVLAVLAGMAWRAALLLAVAAGADRALRGASAATRHRLWTGAVCGVFLLVPLSLLPPLWRIPIPTIAASSAVFPAQVNAGEPAPGLPAGLLPAGDAHPSAAVLLAALWAAGALAVLARLGVGVGRLWWIGARAPRLLDERITDLARRSAAEAGIAREVRLRMGAAGSVPVTWGTWRPTVLLPGDAAAWPEERLRAVLLHELAHARRGDCAAQWAAAAVCALHWFNPLAWHAAARMRLEAEHAADDAALTRTPAADYARHLLQVAASLHRADTRAAAAMARPTQLRRRIEAVLDPHRPRGGVRGWAAGAGGVLGAALLLALGSVGTTSAHPTDMWAAGDTAAPADFARRYGVTLAVATDIRRAAVAEGIDPELAFRVVRAESGFREATPAGEQGVGLARILPSTARSLQPGVTRAELRDRGTNLRLAFRYLRAAIREHPSDLQAALGIYLRGPRGPTRWDAQYAREVLGARTGAPAYRGTGVVP
ncbi:MAG TPA: M56 family metallopeptidase [Longimicrobium sp.]|jgi:beta-lactamase regulating signal transducer with metallopeptidase domain